MKKEKVSQIIGQIDEKYIEEAAQFSVSRLQEAEAEAAGMTKQSIKSARRLKWKVAACLAILVLAGSGVFAIAAEAKEYRAAASFFMANGLSAEGLTRAEIKAVYRDITTKSFTYGKTAEVIGRTVSGWEIAHDAVTPEELSRWWERKEIVLADQVDPADDPRLGAGFRYLREEKYKTKDKIIIGYDKSILKCYKDRELLWTAEFPDLPLAGYSRIGEMTLVWLQDYTVSSSRPDHAWVACLDENGKQLFLSRLDHGFNKEYVASVLKNDDGSWAVISRGDLKYVCLTCLDQEGRELSFHKTEVGNYGIWHAARLGDGYLIHLGSFTHSDYAHLYRMDREGNLTGDFSFEADDCEYHVADMTDFGGQLFLSVYAVPKQNSHAREEISNVMDYIDSKENNGMDITSAELTPLVRDNYTAVLLICEPDEGTPQTFWSVKGSLGSRLSVNDSGQLEWNVESIASTFYSPLTSSFSIGGYSNVLRYTFDAAGTLLGQTDTGETATFAK